MPTILLVEDYLLFYLNLRREMKNQAEVLHAPTLIEGDQLFQKHPEIDLIIMDACVPGNTPNAMPLVEKIVNSGYKNPIIASSSVPAFMELLLAAGATHHSDKDRVVEMTRELLAL